MELESRKTFSFSLIFPQVHVKDSDEQLLNFGVELYHRLNGFTGGWCAAVASRPFGVFAMLR